MSPKLGEKGTFCVEGRGQRKVVETEISLLELPFTQVTPFGEGDGFAVVGSHGQRVTMHQVL